MSGDIAFFITVVLNCSQMSSLAAARADNFYFPPEWRPEFGGISKFAGSKGANQYEQYGIIRFELPFDGWCLKCGKHVSKGLRFNAKKDKAGKYFTTQIFAFTMKCYDCQQEFVIETDPQNCTYNFKSGLRKHEQEFEPDFDDGIILATSDETRQLIATDPMFKLQHQNEDIVKALSESERFKAVTEIQDLHFKNDYDTNAALRSKNRVTRKRDKALDKESFRKGLSIPLLEHSPEDLKIAKTIAFAPKLQITAAYKENKKMLAIQSQSIFSSPPNNSTINKAGVNHANTQSSTVLVRKTSSGNVVTNSNTTGRSASSSSHKVRSSGSSSVGGRSIQDKLKRHLHAVGRK